MFRKCKIVRLNREQAEKLIERIGKQGKTKLGHPTLHEMTDRSKTVYLFIWLEGTGQEYRIERNR